MKRRVLWINGAIALALVAVVAIGYFAIFRSQPEATSGRTVTVRTGSVTETVTATGTVATKGTVSLAFSTPGTVTSVDVAAGDAVTQGQPLVSIDPTSAQQQFDAAQQQVVSAKQTAASARQQLATAQQTASVNKDSYRLAVQQAKASLDAALGTWSADCLNAAATTCPSQSAWAALRTAEGSVTSAQRAYDQAVATAHQREIDLNLVITQATSNVATAQAKASSDCDTYGSTSNQCVSAQNALVSARQAVDTANNNKTSQMLAQNQAVENAANGVASANVSLRKQQADLATNASTAVRQAQASYDNAVLAQKKGLAQDAQSVASAQAALTAFGVGSTKENATQAQVTSAKAGLQVAQKALAGTTLVSPVNGTVGMVSATVGQPSGNAAVVTVIPSGTLDVSANFSEADAAKLKNGDIATVTFEALPDVTATGKVTSINSSPTSGGSTVTYAATITLDAAPEGVREGMTASVSVTVATVDNVLWAPSAAVSGTGGRSTVTIRKDGKDTVTVVEVGLKGDRGTQITSGVKEGDVLVVNTASTSANGFPFPIGGFGGPGGPGGPGGSRRQAG